MTEDFVLAILRESDRPLTAREIGDRLRAPGRETLSRQGMSYELLALERDGKAERPEATDGSARQVWRQVD